MTRRARSSAAAAPATTRPATGPAVARPPAAAGAGPAAPVAAPAFVERPAPARAWEADPEIVPTRDGRRITRESVSRRRAAPGDPRPEAPAVEHADWLYSAWEPVLPSAKYSETRADLGGEAGPWGRVDTWRPTPSPADYGELVANELQQRLRAYRLINEYCRETRASTSCCFRSRGQIRLWSRPLAALAEVERIEQAERERKQKRGEW